MRVLFDNYLFTDKDKLVNPLQIFDWSSGTSEDNLPLEVELLNDAG
jgi:hypothetical protein